MSAGLAGYDAPSEVFSPIVWFRTPAATSEYRVTALLSSYTNEVAKTASQLTVTGYRPRYESAFILL